ncbi:MAG TPA: hypothetical protein PKH58_01495 [Paludibacteraceae bacterium]|nr:hypothetical protein [Paludibacteraceae bacterium]
MKKERPILFSTDMVQAILEGRKTMTRRTKGLAEISINAGHTQHSYEGKIPTDNNIHAFARMWGGHFAETKHIKCSYGQPGDILWVRETWCNDPRGSEDGISPYYYFKADFPNTDVWKGSWKPSIHMPRKAARIWLEITEIKAERLYSISREDAIAEGCGNEGTDYPEGNFFALWRKINGIDSYQSNPWVWVITYKVLSTTGRPENLDLA